MVVIDIVVIDIVVIDIFVIDIAVIDIVVSYYRVVACVTVTYVYSLFIVYYLRFMSQPASPKEKNRPETTMIFPFREECP